MAVGVYQTGHYQLAAVAEDAGTRIFLRNRGEGPVSAIIPSAIATAPCGITPTGPSRGSVIA
jgi:hypothetical protein